ncbi:MAG: cysteine hydrolase [Spirochaetes bacterium]|nr:cysteine hydrolase [Spirochaetota bacterium]
MSSKALLIIDVQVGLFIGESNGGPVIYKSAQLLNNINTAADKARSAEAPVIFIQHTGPDDSVAGRGKPLWEIHPDIVLKDEDIKVIKTHADAFFETKLNQLLQSMNISSLVIMGLMTEYCVDTTLRRAFSLGYNVEFVSDGHSTYDSYILSAEKIIEHHNGALSGKNPYAEKFAELRRTSELIF